MRWQLDRRSGTPNQADTLYFKKNLFLSQWSPSAVHAGFQPLVGGNTKLFQFDQCTFAYNGFGVDLTPANGPVEFNNCSWANSTYATVRLGQNAQVSFNSCYGEGDNAVVWSGGAGDNVGYAKFSNCQYLLNQRNADPDGNYDAFTWYDGVLDIEGGYYGTDGSGQRSISAMAAGTPISVTDVGHHLQTGDLISLFLHGGTGISNSRGIFKVTKTGANTFTLQDPVTGANITGAGTYSGTAHYVPAARIRIRTQSSGVNGGAGIRGVAFEGAADHPRVVDFSGNDLFDPTILASLQSGGATVELESVANVGIDLNDDITPLRFSMPAKRSAGLSYVGGGLSATGASITSLSSGTGTVATSGAIRWSNGAAIRMRDSGGTESDVLAAVGDDAVRLGSNTVNTELRFKDSLFEYINSSNTLFANSSIYSFLVPVQSRVNAVSTAQTPGLTLYNSTSAAAGAQQNSPGVYLLSEGWATGSGGSSKKAAGLVYNAPRQGTTAPSTVVKTATQINLGSFVDRFGVDSDGNVFTNLSGFEAATSATDGFLYLPTCNGTPTGVPTVSATGQIACIVDRANFKLCCNFAGTVKCTAAFL